MSWLGQAAMNLTSGFIQRAITSQLSPNTVLEVKPEQYSDRIIHCREDAIVLYGPSAKNERYEIILNRPCSETLNQAFSLYRSADHHESENVFHLLKNKIPPIAGVSRECCTLAGIQKLCDAARENPGWTSAHLAASFALLECFQEPLIISVLNVPDVTSGMTALHVAVKSGNLRTVQAVVGKGGSLEQLDNEANTVFHFAADTTREIISVLCEQSTKCLNYRNADGHTPLHKACLADKPDCVKALLLAGADVNIAAAKATDDPPAASAAATPPGYVGNFMSENPNKLHAQDMKFGGTPLHWSCSREVIGTLVEMGCHIDSLNFEGRTALHVMALRGRLECVVALLSHDASATIADARGDTPLHLAVALGDVAVVQALLVFGSDLSRKNTAGAIPRHLVPATPAADKILYMLHAVGAPRCTAQTEGCTRGCQHIPWEHRTEGYDGVPPPDPPGAESRDILDQMLSVAGAGVGAASPARSSKGGRVLCLDGGGIRGLVLVTMLLELEVAVGRPIIHCFDWVSGTSTGGILALALAAGKTLRECRSLYFRMKEHAFVGGRPYSNEPLEAILQQALGTNTVMADIIHPKMIITGVLADRKPVDLCLFRNYPSARDILDVRAYGPQLFKPPPLPAETFLWRAARASGAAPTYFRAFGRFLDGGLIANNPTLDTLTEIHEYNLALQARGRSGEMQPPTVVVSMGTGRIPVTQLKAIDVFRPESIWDTARLYMGVTALGTLLVDQATASDGRVVDRARAWCSMIGVPFHRLSPQMSEDVNMDEKSDEKLVNMLWETKAYMHANAVQVAELAALLNKE